VDDLHRGQVLTTPVWLAAASAVDVALTAVAELSHPLRHNTTVTFHTGAAEVEAKVRLLDRDELRAGETGWAQVRFVSPVAVVKGDGFVIRSPNETLGGGVVVDTRAKRHRRHHDQTLRTLETLAQGSPEEALFTLIARLEPVDFGTLVKQTEGGEEETRSVITTLVDEQRAVALGDEMSGIQRSTVLFTAPGFERLQGQAESALASYFKDHPLRSGMPKEELRNRLGLNPRMFGVVLARWLRSGVLQEAGALVAHPGRAVTLTPAQQQEADGYVRQLLANRFAPQPERTPGPELLAYLAEQRRVVPVGEGVIFEAGAYEEMAARIIQHLRQHETVTLAQVRDMFGASRKFAQAILEHLDERRITRRVGDERVLMRRDA
jgi:selenocysteine-specific elongation factor